MDKRAASARAGVDPIRSATRAPRPSPRSGPRPGPGARHARPARSSASPAGSCCRRNGGKLCFATLRDGTRRHPGDAVAGPRSASEALADWKARRRPRRPRRRHRRGDHLPARRAVGAGRLAGRSPPSACVRCRTSTRAGRPRGAGPAALRRPDRQPGGAADDRGCAATWSASLRDDLHARGYLEVETPMLQAVHGGANAAAVRDPHQRLRHGAVPAHRPRAVPQAARRRRRSSGSSRSAGCSATRASTPRTTPSSRCSRPTRPTATTTRWPTLTRELVQDAAGAALGTTVVAPTADGARARHRRRVAVDHGVRRGLRARSARRSRRTPRSTRLRKLCRTRATSPSSRTWDHGPDRPGDVRAAGGGADRRARRSTVTSRSRCPR